jgi:hypothetical protein
MDYAEIFEVRDGKIIKTFSIEAKTPLNKYFDLAFQKEGSKLYLYLVDGRYVYKYNVSNVYNPIFVERVKDNAWEWFYGVERIGDNIATIGLYEIKIWSPDMKIINAYKKAENSNQYNINISENGKYTFNLMSDEVEIYNNHTREKIENIIPDFNQDHYRKLYFDITGSDVYLVDDYSLKKYDINPVNNSILYSTEFKHISEHGYDVVGVQGSQYIYFSDGIGVVKIDKITMEPVDWIFTNGLGEQFNWAQGLNVVRNNSSEMIIGFNLNGIVALDRDLEVVDFYNDTKINEPVRDSLYLNLNKVLVLPGGVITLNGGGFERNEVLEIEYLDKKIEVKSNDKGRFEIDLDIPDIEPVYTFVNVAGQNSNLFYSISLKIQ